MTPGEGSHSPGVSGTGTITSKFLQGLGNQVIDPEEKVDCTAGDVACRERLGDMLRYYYRQAA